MRKNLIMIVFLTITLIISSDTLLMKNGDTISGKINKVDNNKIFMSTSFGELIVDKDKVEKIIFDDGKNKESENSEKSKKEILTQIFISKTDWSDFYIPKPYEDEFFIALNKTNYGGPFKYIFYNEELGLTNKANIIHMDLNYQINLRKKYEVILDIYYYGKLIAKYKFFKMGGDWATNEFSKVDNDLYECEMIRKSETKSSQYYGMDKPVTHTYYHHYLKIKSK